jgi:PEP-CTERM motif
MSDGGGRPSGHFLDSSLVTLSLSSPVTLTSLNWAINGGTTYWLAAVASDGTVGAWNDNGAMDRWAVTNNQGNWGVVAGSSAPEAEIFSVAAVPEPTTSAMIILGFAGIGLLAYRRKSVRLRLA